MVKIKAEDNYALKRQSNLCKRHFYKPNRSGF